MSSWGKEKLAGASTPFCGRTSLGEKRGGDGGGWSGAGGAMRRKGKGRPGLDRAPRMEDDVGGGWRSVEVSASR
jgi:hypothetical protein